MERVRRMRGVTETWNRGGGRSPSALSDSSVSRNDCGALGWDERGPYGRMHKQSASVCASVNDVVHPDSSLDV